MIHLKPRWSAEGALVGMIIVAQCDRCGREETSQWDEDTVTVQVLDLSERGWVVDLENGRLREAYCPTCRDEELTARTA